MAKAHETNLQPGKEAKPNKRGLLNRLFRGSRSDDRQIPAEMPDGSVGSVVTIDKLLRHQSDTSVDPLKSGADEYCLETLPTDRMLKYGKILMMSEDPVIDNAVKMHVSQALSAKLDTGEIVFIESKSDEKDPIVEDLRATFKDTLNRNLSGWAFMAALYGVSYLRVYGSPGKGITNIRSDYYTHPSFVREYERAGMLCGYTSAWQYAQSKGMIRMLNPWTFVSFKIPQWKTPIHQEPYRLQQDLFDISNDDYMSESPAESLNYGTSLIEKAFGPWRDLVEALIAVNTARRNTAKKDRFIGINTGREHPSKAAEYIRAFVDQIRKKAEASERRRLSQGYVSTVNNHIFPVWSSGSGRIEIQTEDPVIDINNMRDIDFHTSRLASSLGVDKSLLGFSEDMAGGLGEGGFFRVSIIAAIKSSLLRSAMTSGLERLFDIHVAYKHNKVFSPSEKPWKLTFNSLNTAIEAEESSSRESRVNFATAVAGLLQTIDPEFSTFNLPETANWLFTDLMRVDEEKFKAMVASLDGKGKAENTGTAEVLDSAKQEKVRQLVFECLTEVFGDGCTGKN